MNVAIAQLQVEPGAREANLDRALDALDRAGERDCDLVVLPELFTVGYFAFDRYAYSAESLDGDVLTRIRERASDREIAVLAGTFVEDLAASAKRGFETPADDGYANTAVFIDEDGERRGVYRKHHLFGYDSAESDLLTPGESLATLDWGGFTVGITTCYDLRFPALYRRLLDRGTTLVLVPSAWPYPRVEHWRTLPQARAIENLQYVVAANGVGEFEEAALVGRSAVYDPWGTAVASMGEQAGMVTARLDPDVVATRREEFPALEDRRY